MLSVSGSFDQSIVKEVNKSELIVVVHPWIWRLGVFRARYLRKHFHKKSILASKSTRNVSIGCFVSFTLRSFSSSWNKEPLPHLKWNLKKVRCRPSLHQLFSKCSPFDILSLAAKKPTYASEYHFLDETKLVLARCCFDYRCQFSADHICLFDWTVSISLVVYSKTYRSEDQ